MKKLMPLKLSPSLNYITKKISIDLCSFISKGKINPIPSILSLRLLFSGFIV